MSKIRFSVLDFLEGEAHTYILTEKEVAMEVDKLLEHLQHDSTHCEYMYH